MVQPHSLSWVDLDKPFLPYFMHSQALNQHISHKYNIDHLAVLNKSANATTVFFRNNQTAGVIRIPSVDAHDIQEMYSVGAHHNRSKFPAMLQAIEGYAFSGAKDEPCLTPYLDHVPPIVMLPDKFLQDNTALVSLLEDMMEGTCYELFEHLKDAVVLPDGTFAYVDPECVPYIKKFCDLMPEQQKAEIDRSNALIFERLQSEPRIPDQFRFLIPDGQGGYMYKQDLFFSNCFNLVPKASEPVSQSDAPGL